MTTHEANKKGSSTKLNVILLLYQLEELIQNKNERFVSKATIKKIVFFLIERTVGFCV